VSRRIKLSSRVDRWIGRCTVSEIGGLANTYA
jgi:hypothetical protein